jgi:purine nucleosidase
VEILDFFGKTCREQQGFDAPPVHDLCTVAKLADPAGLATRDAFVAVELAGRWTTGMTVTDFDHAYGHEHNTQVATTLDRPRLWDMTIDAIAALSAARPDRHPRVVIDADSASMTPDPLI